MKPAAKLLVLAYVLFNFLSQPHAQTCSWVKLGPAGPTNPLNSSNNYSLVNSSLSVDGLGNIISVSGNHAICGGNEAYTYFLSKYDPQGNLAWQHRFSGGSAGSDVAIDKAGNIYVLSSYFGKMDGVNFNFPVASSYLLKFSPAGDLLWYKQVNGMIEIASCLYPYSNNYQKSFIKYHEASNSLIFYATPIYFDRLTFLDTSINSLPHQPGYVADLLVSRTDTSGKRIWTKVYRNDVTGKPGSRGIDVNVNGQLVISGFFEKSMNFGTQTMTSAATWDNTNARQAFLAEIDFKDGKLKWVKKLDYVGKPNYGGNFFDFITPVAVTESGRIGLIHAYNDTLMATNDLMRNYQLALFDSMGHFIKSTPLITGSKEHRFYDIEKVAEHFYIAGGSDMPIIAKYDTSGNSIFYKKTSSSNQNASAFRSIAVDKNKNIYAGGDVTYYPSATNITVGCGTLKLSASNYKYELLAAFSEQGNIVRGVVYHDVNSNGVKDASESVLAGLMVKAGNNDYAITNENGEYSLYLGKDSFSVTTSANIRYHRTVPSKYSVSFQGFDQLITGRDFAIQPVPGINDLAIDITPLTPRARPGFPVQYQITYTNNGTTRPNGYYTVKLPPQFNFTSADSLPSYNANDSLRFDFVALQPFQSRKNVVTGTVSATTPLQTLLLYRTHIFPDNEDSSISDNTDTILHRVSGAYDPNSKEVYPSAAMPIDSIVSGRQSYEYTLNFQNTGTDTAFTVLVRDTLSPKLDISTFEVVAYSHPVLIALKTGRALEFRFNNILLPDSNVNEPRSHGFVKFRIKPLRTLTLSDTIYNDCSIYFDYNEPVKTNTTSVAFAKDVATGINDPANFSAFLTLFPNPAAENIFYELKSNFTGNYALKIYDLNGRLLYSESKTGFNVKGSLRTGFLSRGMYIFEFVSRKTIARKKFLKL